MTFVNNLKGYKIVLTSSAKKEISKINKSDTQKIKLKLSDLVTGKQNLDIKKIEGKKQPTYRLRAGNYRIIYEVLKKEIIVKVVRIGPRKNVYNFLER